MLIILSHFGKNPTETMQNFSHRPVNKLSEENIKKIKYDKKQTEKCSSSRTNKQKRREE
jgi:hypothetical protein